MPLQRCQPQWCPALKHDSCGHPWVASPRGTNVCSRHHQGVSPGVTLYLAQAKLNTYFSPSDIIKRSLRSVFRVLPSLRVLSAGPTPMILRTACSLGLIAVCVIQWCHETGADNNELFLCSHTEISLTKPDQVHFHLFTPLLSFYPSFLKGQDAYRHKGLLPVWMLSPVCHV